MRRDEKIIVELLRKGRKKNCCKPLVSAVGGTTHVRGSDGVQVVCCPCSRVKFQAKSPIPDPPTRDAARTIGSGPELQAAGNIGEVGRPP